MKWQFSVYEARSYERRLSPQYRDQGPFYARKNRFRPVYADDLPPLEAGEPRPRIKPDDYEAECIGVDTFRFRDGRKLCLKFRITEDVECVGVEIPMYMNLSWHIHGIPPGTKFYKSWVIANNGNLPRRRDRMSLKVFKGKFRVAVRDASPRHEDGTNLPEMTYSVVDHLIERIS